MHRVTFCVFTLLIQRLYACQVFNAAGPGVHQLTEPLEHGEGPTWDPRTGLLYYVDLHEGKIFSYDMTTGRTAFIRLNGDVTPVVQVAGEPGRFYAGLNRTIVEIEWDGVSEEFSYREVTVVAEQWKDSRFNDGKADCHGRLVFGTIGVNDGENPNQGLLYLITKDNKANPRELLAPVTISNGLTWNADNTKFYYIDTATYKILQYDFNHLTGDIANPELIYDFLPLGEGKLPDGMTIDKRGHLFVALVGGGSVVEIDPVNKELVRTIAVPATYVTSVIFGGQDLDVLFVTTSRRRLNAKQREREPAAGSVFAITGLNTSGYPVYEAESLF